MGPTFYSLAVRTPDPTAVREQIVNWMTAKGFELSTTRRMSRIDPDRERGFYLFSKGDWTTVLFSDIDEFDRLAFDLRKLNRPSLFLGCQDGKFWGYQLHDGNRLVDEFQTETSYLIWPPEVRESAWKLCLALGIEDRFYEVCRLMRRRAVRSDRALQGFCSALAITPASIPFDLIEPSLFGLSEDRQLDDFHAEQMFFRIRTRSRKEISLHDLPLKKDEIPELSEEDMNSLREARNQLLPILRAVVFLISIFTFLFMTFAFPVLMSIRWCSRLRSYLFWKFYGQSDLRGYSDMLLGTDSIGCFLKAVREADANFQRVDNSRVDNDYFGYSIRLPENGKISKKLNPFEIFNVSIGQATLHASLFPEKELSNSLRTFGQSLVCDENFTTSSGLEGRIIILHIEPGEDALHTISYSIVQSGDLFIKFSFFARGEPETDRKELLKSIAMSFECLPQAHGSSAALPSDELPPSPETQA